MKEGPRIRLAGIWPFASVLDVVYRAAPGLLLLLVAQGLIVTHLVPYGAARAIAMGGAIGIALGAVRMIPFTTQLEGYRGAVLAGQLVAGKFGKISDENGKSTYRSLRPIWPKWDRKWDSDRIVIEQREGKIRVTFPMQKIPLIKRLAG